MPFDMQQREQRWDLAEQNAGFGVWDLDVAAHTVYYSPQWKALLGYSDADEADSTDIWRSRVHPEDLEPMLAALNGHLAGHSDNYEIEFRLRAADGSYRWVLSRGRVVERDAQGAPLRAIGSLTDLTDRRQLEQMRVERTSVEAGARARSEFLARMSHELRTPLNAVLGFAQLLAKRIGGDDFAGQRSYVAHIEQAGWNLLKMIDDVLDLSRAEAGHLEIRAEPVVLAPLMLAMVDAMRPLAADSAVTLRTADLPSHAAVRADPARLQQVLRNLLSNAIQFNVPGGTVTVAVRAEDDAWTLSVSDTGIGIPQAQLPHVFEPFNRLGRTGSGADGVGIGLAVARSVIGAMDGRIAVRSVEGDGSTFEVTLPAVASTVDSFDPDC